MDVILRFCCPVCEAPVAETCRTRSSTSRIPHLRRFLLVLADQLIQLAYGREHRAAYASSSAVTLAQLSAVDDGQSEDGTAEQTADVVEKLTLVSGMELQDLLADALRARSDGSLDLSELVDKIDALKADLQLAYEMTVLRQQGLDRPDDADPTWPDPPTPGQAQVWKELHDNQRLRACAVRRDSAAHAAAARQKLAPPARWRVTEYLPNGYFLAYRDPADARRDGERTQPEVHGWPSSWSPTASPTGCAKHEPAPNRHPNEPDRGLLPGHQRRHAPGR